MTKNCIGYKYYVKSKDHYKKSGAGYRCYVCANKGSDYFGAFLNIDVHGFESRDVWPGCDEWKKKAVAV